MRAHVRSGTDYRAVAHDRIRADDGVCANIGRAFSRAVLSICAEGGNQLPCVQAYFAAEKIACART